ncbi:Uncharacterized protein DAT39_003208, partial [Clarias magur]
MRWAKGWESKASGQGDRLAQTAALAPQPSPHTLHLPLHLTQGATNAMDQAAAANRQLSEVR